MTTTQDERRRLALALSAQLRRLADAALVADEHAVARALVYVRRVELELTTATGPAA